MTCLGLATTAAIPICVLMLLRSLVQACGMPTSRTDLRIVLNTTITSILEVGTNENDPWREVTDYYHPFWTSPVLPADGTLPYVHFEDIGEALAFHCTAIPRGTYSRVPPGDPALSATTRCKLGRY